MASRAKIQNRNYSYERLSSQEPTAEVDVEGGKSADNERPWWREIRVYSIYVLVLLLLTYLFNQLDRYMLAITAKPMAQEIHFGDMACMANTSFSGTETKGVSCNGTSVDSCDVVVNENGSYVCKWDYNGQGYEYQIVAGPVFILIYTFAGIFIGFAADTFNRKILLASCLIFWSAMTLLTGFTQEYWHLVVLRFGLGFSEAGCTPFAASLIADYFSVESRGTALGVYNWGIYMGYSLSYAVGNFITLANINGQGWRWSFILPGIPGFLVGLLILFTLKEPERHTEKPKESTDTPNVQTLPLFTRVGKTLKLFLNPSLFMICIAGSIRNAAGYVFAYNTQPYFIAIHQSKEQIGTFMSWIPIVGGSLGVVAGGFIADRVVKKRGLYARVIVIIASLLLAAPFAAGTLFLNPPYAYISQIPTYLLGEMWIGITLAVVLELVPKHIRTTAIAVYLFIISNIGGNMPLLVPPIQQAFENAGYSKVDSLRGALYILYPGLYVLGALLFILSVFSLKRDQQIAHAKEYTELDGSTLNIAKEK